MIDEALLRPGRFEIQIEFSLPNEEERVQILNIYTAQMRENKIGDNKILADDVDLNELATLTKNFTGAELKGLVSAAQTYAMSRPIKVTNKVEVDPDAMQKLRITRADFLHALEHDIKPAFGTNSELIERLCIDGIIEWSPVVNDILTDAQPFVEQAKSPDSCGVVSILLEGPPKAGKTALAAKLALDSGFPFVKLCTPEDMVGFTEAAKCMQIRKVFDDAYKSPLSCIVVDNIERLLDYGPIGPRYSNLVLQALLVLLSKEPPFGRKLVIICTTSCRQVMEQLEMVSSFTTVLHVPNLSLPEHLINVLNYLNANGATSCFNPKEVAKINHKIQGRHLQIGIKKLLAFIKTALKVCHLFSLIN